MMDDCMTGVLDFGFWILDLGIGMRDTGCRYAGTGPLEIVHAMDLLFSSCIGDYGVEVHDSVCLGL